MCDPSVSVGVPAWTRARGNWQSEWLMSRFSGCLSRLPDAEFEKLFTNLPSTASWQLFKTGDSFPTVRLSSQFGILRLLIEALGPEQRCKHRRHAEHWRANPFQLCWRLLVVVSQLS
jgi:hypothetical protein